MRLLSFILMLVVLHTGCKRQVTQPPGNATSIVGTWAGTYQNPDGTNGKPSPSMSFDFQFSADGKFQMGKRKVWVHGTYQFSDDKTFTVAIQGMPAGPYVIKELTADRLVYERELAGSRVQRTELRRLND